MGLISKKRIFDVSAALTLLPFAVPVIIIGYTAIKLSTGGDGFYIQERQGLNGKPFDMVKLCSLETHTNEKGLIVPRATKVGAFLRKHSLDELPQLWNVLKGDMSMVGPRPRIHNLDGYAPHSSFAKEKLKPDDPILSVKPGLTGPFHIAVKNTKDGTHLTRADKDKLEHKYATQAFSLRRDFSMCLETISIILKGKIDNYVKDHALRNTP